MYFVVPDNDCFSLQSVHFMDSNPTASKEDSVYLADGSEPIGTHWKVGVDYYNDTEVEDIIHKVCPSAVVNKYEAGELYMDHWMSTYCMVSGKMQGWVITSSNIGNSTRMTMHFA